jgi:xanthine dehydrogenase accessory factor
MTELARPTVVRRTVAFAEAVYDGRAVVEGVCAVRVEGGEEIATVLRRGELPVLVDPRAEVRETLRPDLVVDAIMAKRNTGTRIGDAPSVVALGPGFVAGRDVHAVVETRRGHTLGRVITEGTAIANTGVPGDVGGAAAERVVRAPVDGVFRGSSEIGEHVVCDQTLGRVDEVEVVAALDGVVRGLLRSGLPVTQGYKLGDIDPRATPEHCHLVSDKSLAVAGGVLEAACMLLGGVRFASLSPIDRLQ